MPVVSPGDQAVGRQGGLEQGGSDSMSLAVIDAREWQKIFDLRSGANMDAGGPHVEMMKNVLKNILIKFLVPV